MECSICVEIKPQDEIFRCGVCKYENCIDCHKKYLLTSIQDQHCINCRTVIPYDIFLEKFNKKSNWIFKQYKKHREDILWDREKSLIPQTVYYLGQQKKKHMLNNQIKDLRQKIMELETEIWDIDNDNKKNKKQFYQYTYACPISDCKGFLNKENICDLCNTNICKKCYIKINKDDKDHICDEELVNTFNAIKKEAKPCPTCGEFISKVDGCDQMFCIKCGTAFSWKKGTIEKGVIHNPHAHAFFADNPELQNNYNTQVNNIGCRPPIPQRHLFNIINIFCNNVNTVLLTNYYRNIAEFRQYQRERYIDKLHHNNDFNKKIRIEYISNIRDEKNMKIILHRRDKQFNCDQNIAQSFIYTYEIAEIILWNIYDTIISYNESNDKINIKDEISEKINNKIIMLSNLIIDTNKNIELIYNAFGYVPKIKIDVNFRAPYI